MRTRAAALASDELVDPVAAEELARSKSAVAAVAAGFFAAAGAYPDVLLAPVTLLVAGVGSGGRVFDGRLRQPGLGARRPRGIVGDAVPAAARVAISTGVAALTVALAYDRRATLTAVARAGSRAATAAGSVERARLLERIAEVGPAALAESTFVRPLLHVASPSEGGLLTPADFVAASDVTLDAVERRTEQRLVLEPPWSDPSAAPLGPGGQRHGICAVDAEGVFAALAYERAGAGMDVAALGLVAPLRGIPVRRGERRITPGERLPAFAPIAVYCDEHGAAVEVTALPEVPGREKKTSLSVARGSGRWVLASRK